MSNHKFLKKVKNFVSRFKFLSLSILVMVIAVPVIVWAANTPVDGYRISSGSSNRLVFHYDSSHAVYRIGVCVANTSSNDYFIPTASYKEWKSFFTKFYTDAANSSFLTFNGCVGDGLCDATIGETCSTAPADCGTCVADVCGDGYCSAVEGAEICSSYAGNYYCCVDCQSNCNYNRVCDWGENATTCPGDCGSGGGGPLPDPCSLGECASQCTYNCPGYYY